MADLFKEGSVKRFTYDTLPTEKSFGIGHMETPGDWFSIFDYGRTGRIKRRAEALHNSTVMFFNLLKKEGIPSHYISGFNFPPSVEIFLARSLGYDDIEPGETSFYLVPAEVIYSSVVTPVSSLHRDLRSGKVKPEDVGLDKVPGETESVTLPEPRVRFSSKIEETDVYRDNQAEMAGLVGNEEDRMVDLALAVNDVISRDAEKKGILVADGKIEAIMGHGRNLLVADTGYTPDENRLLVDTEYGLVDVSKQAERDYFTTVGWKKELKKAQDAGLPKAEWPAPPEMDPEFLKLREDIYLELGHRIVLGKGGGLERLAAQQKEYFDRPREKHPQG